MKKLRAISTIKLVAAVSMISAAPAEAQVRASERGTVSQVVDGTTFKVDFGRPNVRGRAPIFPDVVSWGYRWTAGANQATNIEINRPVSLAGVPVEPGHYSVWIMPAEEGPWTFMLDTLATRFHTQYPDSAEVAIKFPVEPAEAPFTESLTWYFPEYHATGTTLRMHWATTAIDIPIDVTPTQVTTVEEDVAALYVGEWQLTSERTGAVTSLVLEYRDDGRLHGAWKFNADQPAWEIILLPTAEHMFTPGTLWEDGTLREGMATPKFEFWVEGGQAVSLEMRNGEDTVTQKAVRSSDSGG